MSYFLFLIMIIIVSVLLILVIMVQNPKGGGLSSSLGGGGSSSNIGGVQNTTNFLDKSTWTLATVLFALILLSNFAIPRNNSINMKSATEKIINDREAFEAPAILDTDKLIDSSK
ncbi:MAG: preprotein translocase subunit SecG [Flavobacteriaceae bacterium]|nr:preprotein translocase subunit SecG [Flavobacteriaceae bacterium]